MSMGGSGMELKSRTNARWSQVVLSALVSPAYGLEMRASRCAHRASRMCCTLRGISLNIPDQSREQDAGHENFIGGVALQLEERGFILRIDTKEPRQIRMEACGNKLANVGRKRRAAQPSLYEKIPILTKLRRRSASPYRHEPK